MIPPAGDVMYPLAEGQHGLFSPSDGAEGQPSCALVVGESRPVTSAILVAGSEQRDAGVRPEESVADLSSLIGSAPHSGKAR